MGCDPLTIYITLQKAIRLFCVPGALQATVQGLRDQDLHHYVQQFQVQTEVGDKHCGKQLHSFSAVYIHQVFQDNHSKILVKNLGVLEGLCVFHPKSITHRGF